MIRVGVVIPVLNQFQLAIDLIASIKSKHEVQTFVIPQYRQGRPLAAAWNLGIVQAFSKGCDFVLVCNDDILLSPWTIDALVSKFGAMSEETVMITGNNRRDQMAPDDILTMDKPTVSEMAECPDFSCFMIDARTQELIGKFDEGFNPAYFEDNDYHRRILLAGKKAWNLSSAPFYHYGSRTQNADPNNPIVPASFFEQNRNYYAQKWGGIPGYEAWDRPYNDPNKTYKDT